MKEFKKFITRGNVIDLAVGMIIGAAFTAIVTSLVNDIIMPLISLATGGLDFSKWVVVLGEGENAATLNFGLFIAAIINFIIIAIVIFLMVKGINKMREKADRKAKEEAAPTTKICPFCASSIPIAAIKCPLCVSDLPAEEKKEEA